jgi:hypothetical protein
MNFNEAIAYVERCIAETREAPAEDIPEEQQSYLIAVQEAVSNIVACFKEAHRTSFLTHLYEHKEDLETWAEAFGEDKRLNINESKTYQIGLALKQFLTALLKEYSVKLLTQRGAISKQIADLDAAIKQHCQGIQDLYLRRLTIYLSAQPVVSLPSEEHFTRDAVHNTLSLRVQLCDINSSPDEITENLEAYQRAIVGLTQDASLRHDAIAALHSQRQALLDIPLPPEAQVTPDPFNNAQREVLSLLDAKISALRAEGTQLHELLKTAQQAALARANALSSVSPHERAARLADIDAAIGSTTAMLLEHEASFQGLQADLVLQEPLLLDFERQLRASTDKIDAEYQRVSERKQGLAGFITELKTKHLFSMSSDALCDGLQQATALAELYRAAEAELVAYRGENRLKQVVFKRPAREDLCREINVRIAELEQQYRLQRQGYNDEARDTSASIAIIQAKQNAAYHVGLFIDLLKIKQQHLSMNKLSAQLEFALSDIKAELKSFKTLLNGSPVTLEQMNENKDLQAQLSMWLATNAGLFKALQAKVAEQAQQQQALQSRIDRAVAPPPEAFCQQKQAQDEQFQADQRSQQAGLQAYTEVQALCDMFTSVSTELQLNAMVNELNALNQRSGEIIERGNLSEKRQILLEIKVKLADLETRKPWFSSLEGPPLLVGEILSIETGLRFRQGELLRDQRQSLTQLRSRFFDAGSSIFKSYLQERAVSYVWRDTFSRFLALVLGVFGYKTEAQRRADYLAKLEVKWIKLEQNPDDDTSDLNACIAKGLHDFSPRKEQEKSLHAKLSLFQHAVAEVVVDANHLDPRPGMGSP